MVNQKKKYQMFNIYSAGKNIRENIFLLKKPRDKFSWNFINSAEELVENISVIKCYIQ